MTTEANGLQTIGTGSPGKAGLTSKGTISIVNPKIVYEEGEEEEEDDPDEVGVAQDVEEGKEEGEEGAARCRKITEEVIDENEFWNKREAPQCRRVKVDAALEPRMQEIWKLEQTLKQRREGRASNDKSCWYIAKGIIGEIEF